jgi:CRP-like cAMP-binding protein
MHEMENKSGCDKKNCIDSMEWCENCPMRTSGILEDVPKEAFKSLTCCLTLCRFPARHNIFLEGNPSQQLGSIRSGAVKLSKYSENGKTQIIGVAGPGYLLGYEVFEDRPYHTTAETLTEVEICLTTRDKLVEYMKACPEIFLGLVRFLSRRISDLEQKTLYLGAYTTRQRLAAYLISVVDVEDSNGNSNPLNLSRQEIADTLGMAKETLIRLLGRFAEKGMVVLNGTSITVTDRQKLVRMLTSQS